MDKYTGTFFLISLQCLSLPSWFSQTIMWPPLPPHRCAVLSATFLRELRWWTASPGGHRLETHPSTGPGFAHCPSSNPRLSFRQDTPALPKTKYCSEASIFGPICAPNELQVWAFNPKPLQYTFQTPIIWKLSTFFCLYLKCSEKSYFANRVNPERIFLYLSLYSSL